MREHRYAGRFAATTACAGVFLGQFDAGLVVFSLPALQRHFGASPVATQWVSLGQLLTLAGATAPVSRLADVVGHKLLCTYGFLTIAAASAGCGLAPSLGSLIVLRVVQALGAVMVQTGGVALLVSRGIDRPRTAMTALHAARILGLVAGPAAGGLIIALAGWRWVFLTGVPTGCLGVAAARYLLPRTRTRTIARPAGAPDRPLPARRAWSGAAVIGALAGRFALFTPLALLPHLCAADRMPPLTAGVITAAAPAGYLLAAVPASAHRFVRRTGDRFATMVAAAGCTAATAVAAADPVPGAATAGLLAVFGICSGVLTTSWNAALMRSPAGGSPRMGTRGAVAELGTALSVATVTLCLHLSPPESGPGGARLALAGAGLATLVVTALIAITALPVRPAREPSVQLAETPPDARFLLANERTFLAWNRTALALVAAGLAIVQLLHPFPGVPWGRHLLAVPLILLGALIAAIGYVELRRNQRALHRAEPLPPSILPTVLSIAVTTIAVACAAVLVISAARSR